MKPWRGPFRRVLLVLHVATSVGLMGAVAAFLLLAIFSAMGTDPMTIRSAYPAMDLLSRFLILPLAFATIFVGVFQSLVTHWGLVRHWWVLSKLVLSLLVVGVLSLQIEGIRTMAVAAGGSGEMADSVAVRWSLVVHSAGGFVVLGLALILSIFKPPGRTLWGG